MKKLTKKSRDAMFQLGKHIMENLKDLPDFNFKNGLLAKKTVSSTEYNGDLHSIIFIKNNKWKEINIFIENKII